MARLKVGVLISGRGSNLQALIDACAKKHFPAEIVTVISNVPGVQGLARAQQADIPTRVIPHKEFQGREPFEIALTEALREAGAEFVCLAGFMRVVTPTFIEAWPDKLINIHPSLLPAFQGLHTHARALKAGVRFAGCTVHFVRPAVDDGPIIVQAAVPILPGDDEDKLAARVLEAEHKIYPLALKLVAEGRTRIVDGRVEIADGGHAPKFVANPES